MNVYILTKEPFPNGMAAVKRIKCYAKAMLSANINCKVIVWNRADVNSQLPYIGRIDGIPYQFIGRSSRRRKGKYLGRIQSLLLQLWLPFFLYFNIKKSDIVFSYGLGIKQVWRFLIYLVHKRNAYYVSELCELPYGTSIETNKTIKNRKYYYKHLFPTFDGVISISDALTELAKKYCNNKCLIRKIPILVEFENYDLKDKSSEAEYPYIFHSGTLYEQKDGILGMIEAFGIATQSLNNSIHFILTGSIEESPHSLEIIALIQKYNLQNVIHFLGYLSDEELRNKLSKSSLVIINKYTTQQNQYCFSTKLAEYMAASKPIIITNVGEAMNWLKDKHDCHIVEANNTKQIAGAIIDVFSNYNEYIVIGNNARKTCVKNFDYRNYGISFQEFFTTLENRF